jgi:hypothetical protein
MGGYRGKAALSKISGKQVAIDEAEKPGLTNCHLRYVLLRHLYLGQNDFKARVHLNRAFKFVKAEKEQKFIRKDILKFERLKLEMLFGIRLNSRILFSIFQISKLVSCFFTVHEP